MARKLGLDTRPAAWPAGVSLLAQAVDACQRCDTAVVCGEWLARAPIVIEQAPQFCPNAATFAQAKSQAKKAGG